jgi:hypothetical protein
MSYIKNTTYTINDSKTIYLRFGTGSNYSHVTCYNPVSKQEITWFGEGSDNGVVLLNTIIYMIKNKANTDKLNDEIKRITLLDTSDLNPHDLLSIFENIFDNLHKIMYNNATTYLKTFVNIDEIDESHFDSLTAFYYGGIVHKEFDTEMVRLYPEVLNNRTWGSKCC